jgi:hypothetical protein
VVTPRRDCSLLFRSLNDRIRELGASSSGDFDFVCECSNEGCAAVLRMAEADYARLRADVMQFAVMLGHERVDDDIVERREGYFVVKAAVPAVVEA